MSFNRSCLPSRSPLAAQWRAWGIKPDSIVGHSMGEAAAAVVSGALTLEEAAQVITTRSRLMKTVSGRGAMAIVELTMDQALEEIAGKEKELAVAVCNSPRSTVLSGDPTALDAVLKGLESRDVFCRKIKVDVASHSPQMEPLRLELIDALSGLRPTSASVPVYSTVTGSLQHGQYFDASYWGENLRKPVQFAAVVARLFENHHNVFIEMSPHPLLLRAIKETITHLNRDPEFVCLTLPSIVRDEDDLTTLLSSLGRVYVSGYPFRWEAIYPQPKSRIKLPYPWQRKRYWFDDADTDAKAHRSQKKMVKTPSDERVRMGHQGSGEKGTSKSKMTLLESLNAAEPGKQRQLVIEGFLKKELSYVLSIPMSRIDSIKAFKAYGMDSLRAMHFRSRVESATALKLSSTIVWNYPNIKKTSGFSGRKPGKE